LLSGPEFPSYTPAERLVDAIIHLLGLVGASIALACLLAHGGPASGGQLAALIVYGAGLLGMLSASAIYNLAPAGPLKAVFRRVDRAMIFVMIAGSYTPFAIGALRPEWGMPLCITVWILAAIGVGLCLVYQHIYDRISLGLYLAMGWLVLAVLPSLIRTVSAGVLALLLLGGIIYSLGSLVHTRVRLPFHNAAWHAMVVVAAALHLIAIAQLSP
jgi:hemolysin III